MRSVVLGVHRRSPSVRHSAGGGRREPVRSRARSGNPVIGRSDRQGPCDRRALPGARRQRAVERSEPVGDALQPGAVADVAAGSNPRPSSLHLEHEPSRPRSASRTTHRVRLGVLRHVLQGLEAGEVRRPPRSPAGSGRSRRRSTLDGHRRPCAPAPRARRRVPCRPAAAGRCRARGRGGPRARRSCPPGAPRASARRALGIALDQPCRRAAASPSSATSCCCAPSWMLRSSRRRSRPARPPAASAPPADRRAARGAPRSAGRCGAPARPAPRGRRPARLRRRHRIVRGHRHRERPEQVPLVGRPPRGTRRAGGGPCRRARPRRDRRGQSPVDAQPHGRVVRADALAEHARDPRQHVLDA